MDQEAYSRYLGRWSALFVPVMLAAAGVTVGGRVLDVAAGSGEATGPAASIVGPRGHVVGLDISLSMVAAARTRLRGASCGFVAADGMALPFADTCFDSVICQLGLMFFPEPVEGLREFRRVLRPGGRAAACVISTADRAPMWGPLADALSAVLPQERKVLRMSFRLADPAHLMALFVAGGFSDVEVRREERAAVFSSFDDYWTVIESGTGQLPHAYRGLPALTRRSVRDEVQGRLVPYESEGRLELPVETLIAAGTG